jgi:hypothetical protein
MMASINVNTIFAIKDVASRFLPSVATNGPFRFDWRWIANIVDQQWTIQTPIQMHAVTAIDDCRW